MNSVIDTPVNTTTNDNAITTDVKKKRGRKKRKEEKNMNYNKLTFGDFSRNEIITTTIHRPRYMDDSCKFLINEIDYNCSTIYSFSKNIRFSTIELAHIKECKI